MIHDVFAAGARSYILKSDLGLHLVAAIRALGEHRHYFTSRISEVVFARYLDVESGPGIDKNEGLTPREREVLDCIRRQQSDKEIAAHLNISPSTVHVHMASLFKKLKVHTRAEAILKVMSLGSEYQQPAP